MIETSIGTISKKDFIQKANEGTLPENLIIKGYSDLRGYTTLTSLPKGLQIGWCLFIEGCTSLKTLPEGLQIKGSLILKELLPLPYDMIIGDKIYADESFIQNYPFKEIPKILHLPFEYELKQLLLERLQ